MLSPYCVHYRVVSEGASLIQMIRSWPTIPPISLKNSRMQRQEEKCLLPASSFEESPKGHKVSWLGFCRGSEYWTIAVQKYASVIISRTSVQKISPKILPVEIWLLHLLRANIATINNTSEEEGERGVELLIASWSKCSFVEVHLVQFLHLCWNW